MNEWLDKYDKQIRADVIDDFVHKVKEHHYLLSDVINSTDIMECLLLALTKLQKS